MTIKLSSIKTNPAAELEGDYISIPEWPGVSLGVRSLEIPAYKIALDILVQRFARKYKGANAPPAVRDAEVGKLLGQHILFGWEGFEEEYTQESAIELLGSPEGRNLVKQTLWAASQVGETEVEFIADETKNSATPSATN